MGIWEAMEYLNTLVDASDHGYLMHDHDREMFRWVREFNPYDLYSKSAARPDVERVKPYYEELIAEYFPAPLRW